MASNISMIQITEEALRAMANLNAAREPNWLEIKKWMRESKETLQRMAAFAVDVPADKVRFFQGLAWAINDLYIFSESPKEAMEKIQIAKERAEKKLEGTG
jgi:hypothetical protein